MVYASIYNPYFYSKNTKQREIPNINIVEEFKLIQSKKSKLSRNKRDYVIRQFYKNFIPLI